MGTIFILTKPVGAWQIAAYELDDTRLSVITAFIESDDPLPIPPPAARRFKASIQGLRIRARPSDQSTVLGGANKGEIFAVTAITQGPLEGGIGEWGDTVRGWLALKYCQEVL